MKIDITESQIMNLLVFLDRVNCTGREAFAMVDLLNLFGNLKKDNPNKENEKEILSVNTSNKKGN